MNIVQKDKKVINIDLLQNRKKLSDGWQAACPCCQENGNDHDGTHLRVWSDLRFNCVVANKDRQHNKRILQLLGVDVGDIPIENFIKVEEKPQIIKQWDIEILKGLLKNYDYWNKRGISSATCEYFKMGLALKGQLNQRLIIPIIDKYNPNKIIGFTGRTIRQKEEVEKYKIVKWKHLGEKDRWLLPAIDSEIQKSKSIILVESPGCFLTLFEHNIKNTVCLFGTSISSTIMGYLIKMNPDKILIATNNELDSSNGGVGNKAAVKLSKQLGQFFNEDKIKIALPIGGKDFNEVSKDNIELYRKTYLE